MNPMTKVLIVSVFYNRESLVESSVKSVVNQMTNDMHLILVDDGSTDSTLCQLKLWEAENVTVIGQANMGFVKAINKAIAAIDSSYIAIHGAGDRSLPGRFKKQASVLDGDPRIGVVGCHYLSRVEGSTMSGRVVMSRISEHPETLMVRTNPFSHGEVMFRRSLFEGVGGYREFFTYAQDRDLWCRLSHLCMFKVIQETLYERLAYLPGSVSGNPEKSVRQRYLSAFAVHCHKERIRNKRDPLTELGQAAFDKFTPPFSLAFDFFRKSIRSLSVHDLNAYSIYKQECQKISKVFSFVYIFVDMFPDLVRKIVRITSPKFVR